MFDVILRLLKPNGRIPQIGDNDNGRLRIFAKRKVLDMHYLLSLAPIFFQESNLKAREFGFCEEAIWVLGEEDYEIWQDLEANYLANIRRRAFADAGWYIMRDHRNYMFISCGPNGQSGNGGHRPNGN